MTRSGNELAASSSQPRWKGATRGRISALEAAHEGYRIYSDFRDSLETGLLHDFDLTKPITPGEPGRNRTSDTRIKSPFTHDPPGIQTARLLTTDTQQMRLSRQLMTTGSPCWSLAVLDGPARNGRTMDDVKGIKRVVESKGLPPPPVEMLGLAGIRPETLRSL